MAPTLLPLALALLLPGDLPARSDKPREPNPLAPSLPLLTDEEEEKLDRVIDRFIRYDQGKLPGEEGRQALADFQRLGPEAIPALIRGLNRAAHIEGSCPAVLIAKKLARMLSVSDDPQLLDFARENVGLGVARSRHMAVLKDLRLVCALRKQSVARNTAAAPRSAVVRTEAEQKPLRTMTVDELAEAAGRERGSRLKQVLLELEKRRGDGVVSALGSAAATVSDEELKQQAREILARYLGRQSPAVVKEKLADDRAEVRAAAARVAAAKGLRFGSELIGLLEDPEPRVRQAAREALVRLARGPDFGPEPDAADDARAEAVRRWRDWWVRQGSR
jgi:hypothetical protein